MGGTAVTSRGWRAPGLGPNLGLGGLGGLGPLGMGVAGSTIGSALGGMGGMGGMGGGVGGDSLRGVADPQALTVSICRRPVARLLVDTYGQHVVSAAKLHRSRAAGVKDGEGMGSLVNMESDMSAAAVRRARQCRMNEVCCWGNRSDPTVTRNYLQHTSWVWEVTNTSLAVSVMGMIMKTRRYVSQCLV